MDDVARAANLIFILAVAIKITIGECITLISLFHSITIEILPSSLLLVFMLSIIPTNHYVIYLKFVCKLEL